MHEFGKANGVVLIVVPSLIAVNQKGGLCEDSEYYTFFNDNTTMITPPVFGACLFEVSSLTFIQALPYCVDEPTLSTGY